MDRLAEGWRGLALEFSTVTLLWSGMGERGDLRASVGLFPLSLTSTTRIPGIEREH